jgi:hypothetical protein
MTDTFKPWGNHGPDPCDMCGVQHFYPSAYYDDEGYPLVDPDEPLVLAVKLYGFTDDGTPLYVEATRDEPGSA